MVDDSQCRFEIEFVSGPSDGAVKRLYSPEAIVGSERGVDVLVASDNVVAARHARIKCVADEFSIEDLGSSGGTTVNGLKIAGKQIVRQTDIVRVGYTEFVCRASGSENVTSGVVEISADAEPGA